MCCIVSGEGGDGHGGEIGVKGAQPPTVLNSGGEREKSVALS